jgi:hypothetical protein
MAERMTKNLVSQSLLRATAAKRPAAGLIQNDGAVFQPLILLGKICHKPQNCLGNIFHGSKEGIISKRPPCFGTVKIFV